MSALRALALGASASTALLAPLGLARTTGTRSSVRCVAAGVLARGRDRAERHDERPAHRVRVRAFCMDEALVTRDEFGAFTRVTGYVTTAERGGLAYESLEGLRDWAWQRVPGGSWRRPASVEDADTRAFYRGDAPVVQVSWHDARAFCAARGGRLPSEAEWEYAMRAGSAGTRFPWGDDARDARGRPRVNSWQGASHARNEREDGWVYVSPVRAYEPNAWGFYDPAGNVWQWTADRFARETYARTALAGGEIPADVRGGSESAGAAGEEPNPSRAQRVVRGGSWWCGGCTCDGHGLWYRGHNAPSAAFSNLGFRCAYDDPGSTGAVTAAGPGVGAALPSR